MSGATRHGRRGTKIKIRLHVIALDVLQTTVLRI